MRATGVSRRRRWPARSCRPRPQQALSSEMHPMKFLENARKLEARLSRTFAGAAELVAQRVSQAGPQEPLQVVHAIVDAVEDEVQPAGRGIHVFPFNRIKVSV